MVDPLHLANGLKLSIDLLTVMQKLQRMFGGNLVVTKLNSQGASFYVRNLSNEVVIRQMMANKPEIFGAAVPAGGSCVLGPLDFQVLCPLNTSDLSGLTLRYLPEMPDGDDYLSGFWHY